MRRSFEATIINAEGTLRDALTALDRSGCQVVLVADDAQRIVGLLTDGDVRRALLGGASIDDPADRFFKKNFTFVGPEARRADVLDLMNARRISEVPILDASRRVVGLHLMHDILRHEDRPNWAVVMAGGRGTRLAPLTDNVPKPMLRVAGRPILERIVLQLVGTGLRRIFLAINYLGHVVEDHFGDGKRFGCEIVYLREQRPLGTAGALSLLPSPPTMPVLVMNGDLVTQADVGEMLDHHRRSNAVATIGARRYFHTIPFGCVQLEGDRVQSLEEKPTLSRVINAGVYVINPSLIARVPAGREYTVPELLTDAIRRGEGVCAWEIVDDWIDVGQKEQLGMARGETT